MPTAAQPPSADRPVYRTQVRIDPETGSLEAESRLRYIADEGTAREVRLLLNEGLDLRDVRGPRVRSYHVSRFEDVPIWNLVTVELEDVSPGSQVILDLEYAGQPTLPSDQINAISPEWVELSLDSQWHPVFSTFDQQMTGVLHVTLPPDWQVVASGSISERDGAHVVRSTVPQIDVAFVASPALSRTASERVAVFRRDPDGETATAVLEAADSCRDYLDERFGAQDSLPDSKLVLADREGPGYARKNYIVLSRVDGDDRVGLHRFLCHELAHYWTRSAGSFSPHHWMTEAFAEYVAGMYVRESFGPAAFDRLVSRWEEGGRESGPVWTPESTQRTSGAAMYRRAPYLLHRLEARIGAERFDRFLARYMTGDVRTTPALLDVLREVAGAEAEQWFREELASRLPVGGADQEREVAPSPNQARRTRS